ncbi:MAG: hypothetical protein AAB038_04490 [Planctomycetota bacterium]
MKILSIKFLLVIIGLLLLINIAILITGSYWQYHFINSDSSIAFYKINRITGRVSLIAFDENNKVFKEIIIRPQPINIPSNKIVIDKDILDKSIKKVMDESK